MVEIQGSSRAFPAPRQKRLLYPNELRLSTLSTKHVQIDWQRLIAKRESTEIYTNVLTTDH